MLRFSLLSLTLLAFSSLPLAKAEDKWVSLFDGKTLDGWKVASHGKAKYEVKDGTIHGITIEGSPNTFLASEKEYGDFELEFEVKVHDKLNSGVQIRSREKAVADVDANKQGLGVFHGPQVEIEAGPGKAGYVYGESTKYGWLSPEPKNDPKLTHDFFKNGEWNNYRIVAKGPQIQTWINGHQVADLTHEEIYKTHPKGHIGLQVHGIAAGTGPYDVAWRNIRIMEH